MGAFSGFVGLLEKIDLNSALSAFSGRVPDVDVENAKPDNLTALFSIFLRNVTQE